MNPWTVVSVLACGALIIKLLFFTDEHRAESRWIYRVLLYIITVYAASHLVTVLYDHDFVVHPTRVAMHLMLLVGAIFMRPEFLPWNQPHDPASKVRRHPAGVARRIR